ncbi:alpha/beta hydrolase fold domain-containing protein, partial [Crossiella equi]
TAGHALPRALVSVYGALDMTLGLDGRTSARRNPAVPPWLVRLMYGTYFADASRRAEPLASPVLDAFAGFPPTLVLTAEFDTMTAENEHLADGLAAAGVAVRRAHYTGVDHGFLHLGPAPVTALAFEAVAGHLRAALHG